MYIQGLLFISLILFTLVQVLNTTQIFLLLIVNNSYWEYFIGDVLYVFGRMCLVILFVSRLYHSFRNIVLSISKIQFAIIIIIESIGVILYITSATLTRIHDLESKPVIANIVTIAPILHMLLDISMNVVILKLFLNRLKELAKNTAKYSHNTKDIELYGKLINKFTYLALIAIISTILSVILGGIVYVLYIGTENVFITYPILGIDSIINAYSVYYSMAYVTHKYNKNCLSIESKFLNHLVCIYFKTNNESIPNNV